MLGGDRSFQQKKSMTFEENFYRKKIGGEDEVSREGKVEG